MLSTKRDEGVRVRYRVGMKWMKNIVMAQQLAQVRQAGYVQQADVSEQRRPCQRARYTSRIALNVFVRACHC